MVNWSKISGVIHEILRYSGVLSTPPTRHIHFPSTTHVSHPQFDVVPRLNKIKKCRTCFKLQHRFSSWVQKIHASIGRQGNPGSFSLNQEQPGLVKRCQLASEGISVGREVPHVVLWVGRHTVVTGRDRCNANNGINNKAQEGCEFWKKISPVTSFIVARSFTQRFPISSQPGDERLDTGLRRAQVVLLATCHFVHLYTFQGYILW